MSFPGVPEREFVQGPNPVTILHQCFPGVNSPTVTFKSTDNFSPHQPQWQCYVDVPGYGSGHGTSYSKKKAKTFACIDVLAKLGYDITPYKNYYGCQEVELNHENNKIAPSAAAGNFVQTVSMNPLPASKIDDHVVATKEFNTSNSSHIKVERQEDIDIKNDPDGPFTLLRMLAKSPDVNFWHGSSKDVNPCGYLIMLCQKAFCEFPTYVCERGPVNAFVTTASLGPWTASGAAPTKKRSKYLASSSLISKIENH